MYSRIDVAKEKTQKHRERCDVVDVTPSTRRRRRETTRVVILLVYTHILTPQTYMSQCSCHSWNTSMDFVSSGSAHVISWLFPILRLMR